MSRESTTDKGSKKAVPLLILKVLMEGDAGATELSQTRIGELLAEKYECVAHRTTIQDSLRLLEDCFEEVSHRTCDRRVLWSWRERETDPVFEASQARYLADSVIAAKRIPLAHKAELMRLVVENSSLAGANESTGTQPWDGILSNLDMECSASIAENPEYFLNVEILDECLRTGSQVSFRFGETDRHGKFAKAAPDEKDVGPVTPLFLMVSDGTYYLACRFPASDKTYHYRVDLMHDMRIAGRCDGSSGSIPNTIRYRAEHPYMFTDSTNAVVRIKDTPKARNIFFDRFGGGGAQLIEQEEDWLKYRVRANKAALCILACQLAGYVEVLEPSDVRDEVIDTAKQLEETYGRNAQA